jgi:hypothetical protein
MAYFLAAAAASGIFVLAGRRSRRVMTLASDRGDFAFPVDPLWGETESDVAASPSQADVSTAIRLALKRLRPIMASKSMQAEVAASSGLLVRMQAPALTDMLEEMVASAIHNAPASRLLLTASMHGDRVYVGVTDDMPGADTALRASSVRGLMERVAMRGGALDVTVQPSEGTTMTLRLAAALHGDRQEQTAPEPTQAPAAPLVPSTQRVSFGRTH